MMKIVCIVALFCAVAVQGEDCFDKEKMKAAMGKYAAECKDELKDSTDRQQMGKCIMRKKGIMVGDKTDYDKLVAKVNETFTSESKKKIVLDAIKDCKEKHPDMGDDFMRCYGMVMHKECM